MLDGLKTYADIAMFMSCIFTFIYILYFLLLSTVLWVSSFCATDSRESWSAVSLRGKHAGSKLRRPEIHELLILFLQIGRVACLVLHTAIPDCYDYENGEEIFTFFIWAHSDMLV